MDLIGIIKKDIKLDNKLQFIELALAEGVLVTSKVWSALIKSDKDALTFPYTSLISNRGYHGSKYSITNEVILSRSRESKKPPVMFIKNITEFMNTIKKEKIELTIAEKKSLIEELIFAKDIKTLIKGLDLIPNLNKFFKDFYVKPTTYRTSIDFFNYLKARKYNYKNDKISSCKWLVDYINSGNKLNKKLISSVFYLTDCNAFRPTNEDEATFCINEIKLSVIKNNKLASEIDIFKLDKLFIDCISKENFLFKKSINDLITIRKIVFEQYRINSNPLSKLDESVFYPHYYKNEELAIAEKGFKLDGLILDTKLYPKLRRKMITKIEGNKVYKPNNSLSRLIETKAMFPQEPERNLLMIPESLCFYSQ